MLAVVSISYPETQELTCKRIVSDLDTSQMDEYRKFVVAAAREPAKRDQVKSARKEENQ